MFHRFGRVIIILIVSTALGMPQGHGQDARAAGEAAPAALERQSAGLPEVLTLATAHTSAGRFAEGHQVLETASTPETQHALRLALAALHVTWAHHLAQRFAYTDARAQYQAALALRRAVGDQAGEGTLLDRLGTTHRVQSQYREAIAYFAQALERQRAVGDRTGESATLTHLGEACSGLSQFPQAIATYEQALALARDTGNRLGEGTLLEHLGAVAVAVGQYPQALTYIEQALDIAREVGDWAGEGTALTTLGEMQRDAQLNADLKIANEAFQTLLKDLRAAFSSTPTSGNRLADVQKEVGFQADLANLGPGTVLLYTVVTATHYRVIVITPETQVARDYPITAAALNCKVQAFRETLRTLKDGVPEFDPRPLAQELYQILFVPVARDLHGAQAQTLLWNLDGVLRYLPVAALYDGERYLVERYRTVVYTDVSRARLKDLPSPPGRA